MQHNTLTEIFLTNKTSEIAAEITERGEKQKQVQLISACVICTCAGLLIGAWITETYNARITGPLGLKATIRCLSMGP